MSEFLTSYNHHLIEEVTGHIGSKHHQTIQNALQNAALTFDNPNTRRFKKSVDLLPKIPHCTTTFSDTITITPETPLTAECSLQLEQALRGLIPWRKGPFSIADTHIDTEWKSNLKWDRIASKIPDQTNKIILDIGSSSGYYMYRLAPQNPKLILGVDPSQLFYMQFRALQAYIQQPNIWMVPCPIEELFTLTNTFDTIFCMGILYHERSPIDFLRHIRDMLKPNGTLILETLIIPGDADIALSPHPCYAKMKNAFFIPTLQCLQNWLSRTGFHQQDVIFSTPTTSDEQRHTEWLGEFQSLETFIHPTLENHTIEGYPGPIRAGIIAKR